MVESGTSGGGILTSSFIWAMIAAVAMGETVATEEDDEVDDEGMGFSVVTFGVMER